MNKMKIIFWGMALFVGLLLTGCAGYNAGYGYYGNPYYDDYDSGYFAYPYDRDHHEFGEHHREFGNRPEWGEHHEREEHHEGDEHHEGSDHRHR